MNNAGLPTTYEEGEMGQFELFRNGESFLKKIGHFIDFEDVKEKLTELGK